MTEWMLLGLALLLVGANGLFVAAEFSLVTVDRSGVQERADAGDRRSATVLSALRLLSTQLSASQLGITLSSLLVGYLAEPSLATLLAGPLESAGVPPGSVIGVGVVIALVMATGFQMVLGELVPKNAAISRPLQVARVAVPLQNLFTVAARPLIRFLNGNANWLVRRMGVEPQEELASARSAAELQSLVRRSAQVGTLAARTAALIDRSLRFGERTAADVLTPRVRVRFVTSDTSVEDVIELSRTTGHSRFPVIGEGGRDDVVGIVELRAALRVPSAEAAAVTAGEIAARPVFVPETVPVDDLLQVLRREAHLAVVLDEYGGTAGVVTLEDLVEELVGEVVDEHDRPLPRVARRRDGSLLLSGLLRPDEARATGLPAPDSDDYETLAGFVVHRLGRIAQPGDAIDLDGWTLTVRRVDGRRIDLLEAVPTDE